ncbi:MAG: zonular occludens toxin domain-containing protein [Candidatus Acidiferrum sp.]
MSAPIEGKLVIIDGGLGSGKTALAAEMGMLHLAKGGTVCGNVVFEREKLREWLAEDRGLEMDDARLIDVQDDEAVWTKAVRGNDQLQTMLICDEAHIKHFSRDWSKTPREQIIFNTMLRKLKIIVIYVTQDLNNLDKTFRSMKTERWSCRNARQKKIWGLFNFPFDCFVRVPYYCVPNAPDAPMQAEFCFHPLSFGYYKTTQLVGDAERMFAGLANAATGGLKRIGRPASRLKAWGQVVLPAAAAAAAVLI